MSQSATPGTNSEFEPKSMVGWYNPSQLAKTGVDVLASALLGTRADFRIIQGLGEEPEEPGKYSHNDEIWIDYVADLGDGWNSTFAVASLLARDTLSFQDSQGHAYETPRGDVLIMGGDQVYPTASRDEYRTRLREPYRKARKKPYPGERPTVFATPGNHDWYDGLVSFRNLFLQPRNIGMWSTEQTRSYFVLKLPHGWWLMAVDTQLVSEIDPPQLKYFDKALREMNQGDRVILCTAEPDWIYAETRHAKLKANRALLEREIEKRGGRLVLSLAGDLHHYRRHEAADGSKRHKITAGGGGAFLHPTHKAKVETIHPDREHKDAFQLKKEYPTREQSSRLTWGNLLFPWKNRRFGVLTGFLYLILAWVLIPDLSSDPTGFGGFLKQVGNDLLASPAGVTWFLVVLGGFIGFTSMEKALHRVVAGLLHGSAHLCAAFFVAWIAMEWTQGFNETNPVLHFFAVAALLFVGGYLIGSMIMGVYLLISLNIFGQHANEAFSSLKIEDFKNFLRLHIDKDGKLTIFPVGIDKAPRKWKKNSGSGAELVPEEGDIGYRLIEGPIAIDS